MLPKYGIVNSAILNLREGPTTASRILRVLERDNVLLIQRDAGFDWLHVCVDDGSGQEGYVSKIYLRFSNVRPGDDDTDNDEQDDTVTGRAEVIARVLNVRTGPGVGFSIVTALAQGTPLDVYDQQGDWMRVRVRGSGEKGWVAAQFVRLVTGITIEGFLIDEPELMSATLEPVRRISPQQTGTSNAIVARTWNSYGGLLEMLSNLLAIRSSSIVAVLAAESGGNAFGTDGRMIIRFENHIFNSNWGQRNRAVFDRHFSFNRQQTWLDHKWRPDERSPWVSFHGNQALEWQVFNFARGLDETSAMLSISMGAPQIMGFNYRAIGYESVQSMFQRFSASAHAHILGVFDFVKGPGSTSAALQALQRRDFLTFASIYNGPARASSYKVIIEGYISIFERLIATAGA